MGPTFVAINSENINNKASNNGNNKAGNNGNNKASNKDLREPPDDDSDKLYRVYN